MFRYLEENKHWIFSGIGVFALSLIITGIIYFAQTGTAELPNSKMSEPASKMSEPTPLQINETLSGLSPLQQADVAKSYEGIKVDWELALNSASKNEYRLLESKEDRFDISFDTKGPTLGGISIWCWSVELSKYPEFKIMKPGRMVRVRGIINKVKSGGRTIDVKDAVFSDLGRNVSN